jgi:hypothetical protein
MLAEMNWGGISLLCGLYPALVIGGFVFKLVR